MKKTILSLMLAAASFSVFSDTSIRLQGGVDIQSPSIVNDLEGPAVSIYPAQAQKQFERKLVTPTTPFNDRFLSGYSYWHAKNVKVVAADNGSLFNTLKVSKDKANTLEIIVPQTADNAIFDVYINNAKYAENVDSTKGNLAVIAGGFYSGSEYISVNIIPSDSNNTKPIVINSIRTYVLNY